MTSTVLFQNCRIFDGRTLLSGNECDVLVEGDRIIEISEQKITHRDAQAIDIKGRTLMPGLIDCHAHPCLIDMHIAGLEDVPLSLMTATASINLTAMLNRGFTTIRDAGGSDWGLREAVEKGLIAGPRIFISGRPLSQTGGHGDSRRRTDSGDVCACASALGAVTCIADGVPEVRKATREQLRLGADQIKVIISGGVSSPNDPLHSVQYSTEELSAIVDEATRWGTYVMAHAYTPDAILHGLASGVRSFEHANLIDKVAAEAVAAANAYVVPTLVTYEALAEHGRDAGLSIDILNKLSGVRDAGLGALEICKAAGVSLAFGTDLLGETQKEQSREFLIRSEVESSLDVLRSATSISAALLNRSNDLGTIAVAAMADILVVDGNPLDDLGLLQNQGQYLPVIMKGGVLHKQTLA
jgi:imidazolonepropionase-like amidohydrolase